MHDPLPEALSFPSDPIPGAIMMVLRESRIVEIGILSFKKERHIFRVRAIITDNPPSNRSIHEIIAERPAIRVELLEESISIFNHYGGGQGCVL